MGKTYSRKGCRHCKVKKKKCDEQRPLCGSCLKSGVQCNYDSSVFVYQPMVSAKKGKNFKKVVVVPKKHTPLEGYEAIKLSIEEFRRSMSESQDSPATVEMKQDRINGTQEAPKQVKTETLLGVPEYVVHWKPYSEKRLLELNLKLDPYGDVASGDLHYHESNSEVQELIWLLFCQTKACNNYILVIDPTNYCIIKWFLHFCNRYPLIGYMVNGVASNLLAVRCSDTRWHQIRERSMDLALQTLASVVQSGTSFTEMAICLLCIMFLFSERSAARSNAWRIHLKGALAISRKCDELFPLVASTLDTDLKYAMEIYAFSKNWFVTAETIACLSAPNGGAITSIEELKRLISYTCTDVDAGFYVGGFNLMKGYSQSLTPVVSALSEFALGVRQRKGIILSGSVGVLQSGLFKDEEASNLSMHLLSTIDFAEKEHFDLSSVPNRKLRACIRACHLCFCASLRIFILSVLLDKSIYGPEIQANVGMIEELLVTTSCIELSGLCVHWPVFIAAICSPPGPRRVVFMEELKSIRSKGTFVARNSIYRIEEAWSCIDSVKLPNEENFDCIVL